MITYSALPEVKNSIWAQGRCYSYSNKNRAVFHGLSARCLRLNVLLQAAPKARDAELSVQAMRVNALATL